LYKTPAAICPDDLWSAFPVLAVLMHPQSAASPPVPRSATPCRSRVVALVMLLDAASPS
jgi:hypothetical protein